MMKLYNVIVVDPPWRVSKIARSSRPSQVGFDYNALPLEGIASMPVAKLSEANSMCFLWTTHTYLKYAFSILETWGFKYHVTITWDKQNGLCLYGFHRRTEFCLVGLKGHHPIYPHHRAMPALIAESSWCKHSVKPDIFYSWVELFGEQRIDLFARKKRAGWDVWGDEVKSDIMLRNGKWDDSN